MLGHDDARLSFGRVAADIALSGPERLVLSVERRVAEIGREALPRRLAALFDPGPGPGIVRIARISVDIDLDLRELMSGDLADAWARGVASAVAARLNAERGARGVVRFPNAEAFGAAYLAYRGGGREVPAWAFEEFAALELLAPSEAAVELLRAVPAILPALVEAMGPDAPARIARLLDADAAERLMRLLTARSGTGSTPDRTAAEQVARALRSASAAPLEVRTVIALAELVPEAARAPWRIGDLARWTWRASALAAVAEARGGELADLLEAPRPLDPVAPLARAVAALPRHERSWTRAALADVTGDALAELRVLAVALERGATSTGTARRPDVPDAPATTAPTARSPAPPRTRDTDSADTLVIHSPFAGVSLVLPLIRDLGLQRALSPRAFGEMLCALAPAEAAEAAARDPLVIALSPRPVAGDDGAAPAIPADALRGVPDVLLAAIGEVAGPAAWARLVAARFAERLPGLAGSSAAYLAGQFIHRPGRARLEPEAVAIGLAPIPLGVLLRVGGLVGERGPLPWLDDRVLDIALEDG